MRIKKNDTVVVIAGNYRGKKGKVLKVVPVKGRAIVEGVNFIKRHTKPTRKQVQGGIIEKEASINISNLMVVCPKCGEPTRVGVKVLPDGGRSRICKKCGEMFDTE